MPGGRVGLVTLGRRSGETGPLWRVLHLSIREVRAACPLSSEASPCDRVLTAVIATALAVLWAVPSAPAEADGTGSRCRGHRQHRNADGLRARHLGVVRGDGRHHSGLPTDLLVRRRAHRRADVDDQHRRVPVERRRRREARHHRPRRARAAGHADDHDAGGDGAPAPDGQFYNWYDHRDGAKLTTWPPTGDALDPILSSVDNAWLATGLRIVRSAVPELSARAGAIYDSMDFGFYYVPDKNRILFHYSPAKGTGPCCYDTVVSESRIADYVGIAKGELPRKEYYGRWRTFPDTCDYSCQETSPTGFTGSTTASASTTAAIPTTPPGHARAGAARCSRR